MLKNDIQVFKIKHKFTNYLDSGVYIPYHKIFWPISCVFAKCNYRVLVRVSALNQVRKPRFSSIVYLTSTNKLF